MKRAILLAITALLFMAGQTSVSAASCAIEPPSVKPVPPVGCKDMIHECICNSQGQNCQWVWVCVK